MPSASPPLNPRIIAGAQVQVKSATSQARPVEHWLGLGFCASWIGWILRFGNK